MTILAIDFGERYIGLAVYTRKSNTSFALKVIDTKKTNLIEELSKIVENYEIDRIAIGNPIGLNNSETRMSKETDLFIKEVINENFNITVHQHDALFTVQDSKKLRGKIEGAHSKNLFLKNKKKRQQKTKFKLL